MTGVKLGTRDKMFPGLGLFLLSLVFLIPQLVLFHAPPVMSFWYEWAAGVIVILAFTVAWLNYRREFNISLSLFLWILWGVAEAVSALANHYTFATRPFAAGIFWFVGALALLTVSELRDRYGYQALVRYFSYFLLLGGVIQAVLGLARFLGLLTYFAPFLEPFSHARMGGTLNYPTIAGFSLWLSVIAAVYLFVARKISAISLIITTLLMGCGIVATENRSSILYLLVMVAVASVVCLRAKSHSVGDLDVCRRLSAGVGLAVLILITAVPLYRQVGSRIAVPLAKLGYIDSGAAKTESKRNWESVGIRASEFRKALYLAKESPFFGVGVGNYPYQSYRLDTVIPNAVREGTVNTHTHNLFSMVLAEEGIFGVGTILAGIVFISFWWWRQESTIESFFTGSILGIFLIFSNLEFPLWYLNFLVMFLVVCGIVAPTRKLRLDGAFVRPAIGIGVLVVGLAISANVADGYNKISRVMVYRTASASDLQALYFWIPDRLLGFYAGYASYLITNPEKQNAAGQLRLANRLIKTLPMPNILLAKTVLLEFLGKHKRACNVAEKAANSYPIIVDQYDQLMKEYKANPKLAAGNPQLLRPCFVIGEAKWDSQHHSPK